MTTSAEGTPENDLLTRAVARRLAVPRLAPIHVVLLAAVLDALALALVAWFAQFAAAGGGADFSGVAAARVAMAASVGGVAVVILAGGCALASVRRLRRSLPAAAAGAATAAGLVVALGQGPADLVAGPFAVGWCVACLPLRAGLAAAVDWAVDAGLTGRRAVIAGTGPEAQRVVQRLAVDEHSDIRVHAIFDDRGAERAGDRVLDVPVIGRFDDLVAFCRTAEIDLVLITLPPTATLRIEQLMSRFRVLPVSVHLTAWSRDLRFGNSAAGLLMSATFQPGRRLLKRAFDLAVGSVVLILVAPLMVAIAVAIRLDTPGPVFFRQHRHGFNDWVIVVWKFRTMHAQACDNAARRVVTRGDPRVTRVGRVLRKTSLDELPQLFNVISGSLSLVGPRPHVVAAQSSRQEAFDRLVDGYSARHRLPPGITGWAQVHGLRGEIDSPESLRARVDHDLYYIENWSLWFDIAILLRTPLSVLLARNAF